MVTFDLCEGNPGALTFMLDAYEIGPLRAERAFSRMQFFKIRGELLYMLWNDCCDKDTEKAIKIMLDKPIDEIVKHINYENGRGIPF